MRSCTKFYVQSTMYKSNCKCLSFLSLFFFSLSSFYSFPFSLSLHIDFSFVGWMRGKLFSLLGKLICLIRTSSGFTASRLLLRVHYKFFLWPFILIHSCMQRKEEEGEEVKLTHNVTQIVTASVILALSSN